MGFTVGETVVYPNHGAAVIESLETRAIKGVEQQYLVLRILSQNDLVVRVPAANLEMVGVRDVVDSDGLERVFGVLKMEDVDEPANWSRRYKANLEKLHSGNVMKVAEVVRDLWRREKTKGLSAGEKRMLAKARQVLVSELALAEKIEEPEAEVMLDDVLEAWEAKEPITI
ncbi:MAG: CarD family transcriptional regulator [Propionibacteriaceae bacterium]|nr:CarD family transcriptional regulator [Propionibacteriaceae bacterium]